MFPASKQQGRVGGDFKRLALKVGFVIGANMVGMAYDDIASSRRLDIQHTTGTSNGDACRKVNLALA